MRYALLAALLLTGCATTHGGGMGYGEAPGAASKLNVESLPVCGFEAPYLPEPCRMQVAPGEWLAVRNPKPEPTKHHGWLWWLLVGVVI